MTITLAALSATASKAGTLSAILIAAGMLAVSQVRVRALLALVVLAVSPALLFVDMSDSPQLSSLTSRPVALAAAGAVGLAVTCGLAWLISRNHKLFPYLVTAALPFRVPLTFGGETSNLLVPLYLVVGAGALAWIVPALAGRLDAEPTKNGPLTYALAAWLAVFGIASLWSPDPAKAMQDAVFFYIPFATMFVLLKRIEWTAELVRGCAIVVTALALAFSAVAFYEYFSETLLLNPKLLISNQFHTYFRVNSVFFDPNIFGRFLMFAMIGLAAVILDSKSGRIVLACAAASAVLLAAMVMTLSQSSLLGLLTGFATLAALRWSAKLVVGVAFVAAALGAAAVIALPGNGGLSSLRSVNLQSSGRASLVSGGVDLFASKPVQGWGSGSFSVAYQRERGAGSPAAVTASHTTPVTVAAEQGLVGLLVYLMVLFTAVRTALTRARISTARATVSAGLIALIFHSLTYAAFFEDPAAWALMALAIALPLPLTREERRTERAERRPNSLAVDEPDAAATA